MNRTNDYYIYLLDCIELCRMLFLGPSGEQCRGVLTSGIPQLRDMHPPDAASLALGLTPLARAVPAEGGENLDVFCDELESEYVRLFVSAKGGTPAPPYASCHGDGKPQMMGPPALDMQRRLDAAGLDRNPEDPAGKLPPDHVAIQLELLYHLCNTAAMHEDPDAAARAAAFIREAMSPWLGRFREAVQGADKTEFFGPAADWLLQVLASVEDAMERMARKDES